MSKLNLLGCSCVLALTILAGPAPAQYIYLDANGDGINTAADSLNPTGPTVLTIYLNTNHDKDGSLQTCNSHSAANCGATPGAQPLTVFSYQIYLSAVGGTVAWGTFTPDSSSFSPSQPQVQNNADAEFTLARQPPGSVSPAGLLSLGKIPVTVTSGSPNITFPRYPSLPLDPTSFGTSFGTTCTGFAFGNSYVLGDRADPCGGISGIPGDWFDADGVGSLQDGAGPMVVNVPRELELQTGQPSMLAGDFYSPHSSDSLDLSIDGLPSGFHAVSGEPFNQTKQMRAYGALEDSVPEGVIYELTWTASDRTSTAVAHTTVKSRNPGPVSPTKLQERVREVVTSKYSHGMPHMTGRTLGPRALAVLAQMLRDTQYRKDWHKAAQAIGDIGDTSFFDTLRTFVRDRFHGPIDEATLEAIRSAQGSLSAIATVSPRALDYLISSSTPSGWASIPWNVRGWTQEALAGVLARGTLVALAYTDAGRASDLIAAIPMPADTTSIQDRLEAIFVRGLRRVSADVRAHGLIAAWRRTDPRLHGGN